MTQPLPNLRFPHLSWGARTITLALLTGATALHAIAWWLRTTEVSFNVVVLLIAGGILIVNGLLGLRYVKHEPVLGYIFGGASVMAQIFLLILLVMARQGTLQ